jgi:hypothetical protein
VLLLLLLLLCHTCVPSSGAPGVARERHLRQGHQHWRLKRRNHEVGMCLCVCGGGCWRMSMGTTEATNTGGSHGATMR